MCVFEFVDQYRILKFLRKQMQLECKPFNAAKFAYVKYNVKAKGYFDDHWLLREIATSQSNGVSVCSQVN
jgi:hypothetical protein